MSGSGPALNIVKQIDDPGDVRAFGRHVPDLPAWVDVRGALLCGRSTVFADGAPGAFAVATPDVPLVSIVGRPGTQIVAGAIAFTERLAGETPVLIVDLSAATDLQSTLVGWGRHTAILHARGTAARAPGAAAARVEHAAVDVRWIEPGTTDVEALLAGVPDDLGDEIVGAAQHTAVACAWVDGRAAAFAYAPWCTEQWFDISIDTIEEFRRRGLARACADALIARHAAGGRQPVWGALADNEPSLALARALGFEAVAEVAIFEREEDRVVEL